ncbi:hypothetical protein F5Y05DRAFT_410596 [Hypoxylon sp. FL0543]|nr:hypothetical protein F5Y05DRAFT_410596 [Hypoxylon sp. FL0543]
MLGPWLRALRCLRQFLETNEEYRTHPSPTTSVVAPKGTVLLPATSTNTSVVPTYPFTFPGSPIQPKKSRGFCYGQKLWGLEILSLNNSVLGLRQRTTRDCQTPFVPLVNVAEPVDVQAGDDSFFALLATDHGKGINSTNRSKGVCRHLNVLEQRTADPYEILQRSQGWGQTHSPTLDRNTTRQPYMNVHFPFLPYALLSYAAPPYTSLPQALTCHEAHSFRKLYWFLTWGRRLLEDDFQNIQAEKISVLSTWKARIQVSTIVGDADSGLGDDTTRNQHLVTYNTLFILLPENPNTGLAAVKATIQCIEEYSLDIVEDAIPEEFEPYNEQLVLGTSRSRRSP